MNILNNLKFPFPNSENIEKNYSQAGQDLFVLAALNGKREGFYLDIGAGPNVESSNTYLLETEFDWKGVALDLNTTYYNQHKQNRKHYIELVDGARINYLLLLARGKFKGKVIDYVSLDLDGQSTLDALHNLPWNTHKIATLTFEHDSYRLGPIFKEKSRQFLASNGMVMVVSNVMAEDGWDFEDWWVNPTIVDPEIRLKMTSNGHDAKLWSDYIFV